MQRLERREYKYIIDERIAARIRRAIAPYCELDANAAKTGGRYRIDSLYLDSPGLECYAAVEHGVCDRFKLRVRNYPDATRPLCFLEVKHRLNDVIAKTRAKVTGDWRAYLEPGRVSCPPGEAGALDEFVGRYYALSARPVVVVRYEREPYFSLYDDYARVTFDRDICYRHAMASAADEPWEAIDDPISMRAAQSLVVLELKFTSQVPRWMVELVRSLELPRGSYSKYGRAIESLLARRSLDLVAPWMDRVTTRMSA